ncbi:MAG TPA: TonB-dependent receptor [Burkholderiaceae bacterium]|nr:TonB-dependent receptor [Burkholderiaceae bacterium]
MSTLGSTARSSAAAITLFVFTNNTALAQATSQLPMTVITPARQTQAIDEALPATSVITRADIERTQSVDIVSLLSRETGVQFAQSGGRGTAASLFLRGANSSQVLVLVDGVRLNAGTSGAPAVGGIALDAIERIEIVRGNLSSLYGSAAIGGVVQIFTRRGAEQGLVLSAEGGQGRTLDGHFSGGTDLGPVRIGGAIGGGTTAAFSAIDAARVIPGPFAPGANPDIDGNEYLSTSLGATYRSGETLLAVNGWLNRNRTEFDSTADGPTATHLEKSQLGAANALLRTPLNERWTTQLALGASRDRSSNIVSDPASFNNGEFSSDNVAATWTNDVTVTSQMRAQLGAEYLHQVGESTAYDPNFGGQSQRFTRAVGSGWLGLIGEFGPQQLQLNVRQDQYSDVGGATTGLVAYGFRLGREWRLTAQLSNAFRAPSFNDLYFPGFGNPDLAPERAVSGELGLQYAAGDVMARAGLFRTNTRDLIVFDPASSRAENLDKARATGFELAGSWRHGIWSFAANGMLLRAVDEETGEKLLRRAPWIVNASVYVAPGSWSAGFELTAVGPRDDLDINTFQRVQLASYTLARIVASWALRPAITLRARVENLFDADYETVSGYNTQPRTVIVGVDLRF